MTIVNGRFESDSVDAVLDTLVANFEARTGQPLPDGYASALRMLYLPVAEVIVELQGDLAAVLDSAQIDHATGDALTLLTALIGVTRRGSTKAGGTVTFSRTTAAGTNYTVPAGTEVQTAGSDGIVFVTTASATLLSGTTSIDADVEAKVAGPTGNVAPGTITALRSVVAGIESVTNAASTTGGAAQESDEELRERAKTALTSGSVSTAASIRDAALDLSGVVRANIALNISGDDVVGGLPAHSFELICEGGSDAEIAQAILDTMGAGATPWGGVNGTLVTEDAYLPSGQAVQMKFSRAVDVPIYVEADVVTEPAYAGDDSVMDSIVQYVGGVLSSGVSVSGRVGMGETVLLGEIEYAIRDVAGVYNVTNLQIGQGAGSLSTTDLTFSAGDTPQADATDGSIVLNTTKR